MHTNSIYPKSYQIVLEVLRGKHPYHQEVDLEDPNCSVFDPYDSRTKALPFDITSSDVELTVRKTEESRIPSETYSMMMKY